MNHLNPTTLRGAIHQFKTSPWWVRWWFYLLPLALLNEWFGLAKAFRAWHGLY